MARTAHATYPMKLACLIWLASEAGHPFTCAECGKPILPGQAVQFDHRHAVGRGGQNRVEDLRPVHAAKRGTQDATGNPLDCHDRKTSRPRSLATTIGGDTFEHHKTDRIAPAGIVNKRPPGEPRPPSSWPTRKLTASRPFPPRGSRPMNRKKRA